MRILDLQRPGSATAAGMDPKRKGTFTSNLLAYVQSGPVALYFTGWQHAGENLGELLRHRAADLEPPIQMCDALSRNMSLDFETLLAHCLSHARREFVTVAPKFPDECRHVLESLGEVYRADAQAREQEMSPEQRLAHHQAQPARDETTPGVDGRANRHQKGRAQLGLGPGHGYMLKHWEPLTLFLRKAGAPL